jgi:hypothetical protein
LFFRQNLTFADLDHNPPFLQLPAIAWVTHHHTQLFIIKMGSHELFYLG